MKGADIIEQLKKKKLDNGETLYHNVKGRATTDRPVHAMLERVRFGSLYIARKYRQGDLRNVYCGLVLAAVAQIMAPIGTVMPSNVQCTPGFFATVSATEHCGVLS